MSSMSKKKANSPVDFSFQVIAGQLKGRTITAPDLGITRPPLSRIRRSIFDYLVPYLADANYLDLFSGTGSYLFEAVSRGTAKAVGVEIEPKLAESINVQAQVFDIGDKLYCRCEDVFEALPKLKSSHEKFDIIMIAPPQYKGIIDETLKCLRQYPVLADSGFLLCQHDSSETDQIESFDFKIKDQRKYGNTTFTILIAE